MTGINIERSRLSAYILCGLLASLAGLLLAAMTLSGDASASSGGTYTLSSIAAVVIGGTSLMGGTGGAIRPIFAALLPPHLSDPPFRFVLCPPLHPFIPTPPPFPPPSLLP